jgi:(2Fe-2S) ferredoxin
MSKYERHVFICVNERTPENPKGCCLAKGAAEVRSLFKARLKELGLNSTVRANAAGCLDACAFGTTVVVYPEGVWYGGVVPADVEEIIQSHIVGGRVVTRLVIQSLAPPKNTYPPLASPGEGGEDG